MIRPNLVFNYIGKIVIIIGTAMLGSVLWSLYYGEDIAVRLLIAAVLTIILGAIPEYLIKINDDLNYREGFAVVTLGWIAASLVGTVPYLVTGYLPFADAFFETVSGFTTTGASILTDVEALPKSLLFWRSLTHWLGGMGIMALFVAIIVGMGARANQIFRAEVPGPVSEKISPRIRETARYLWVTYVVMSAVLFVLLYVFGMDIFDSLCHTFGTMATGGFSTRNQSVGYYNPAIQWIITVFMFLAGVNFSLHYLAFKNRSLKGYLHNKEFLAYTGIILTAIVVTLIGLSQISSFEPRLRAAAFQVVAIITTTGYSTADYELWTPMAQAVILALMFIGGSAGSTSGSIKVGRYLIMLQRAKTELKQMIHPKAMIPVRFGERVLSPALIFNVLQFFFIYLMLIIIGTVLLGIFGIDIISSFTAVLSCLGNIGPAFGQFGPTENYALLCDGGKYVLAILMLFGRLEIFPILVLFLPDYWKE